MRKLYPILAVAFLPGGFAGAQDITGTWQGTLHTTRDLRTVIKIAKTAQRGFTADFYSIDQNAQRLPAGSVTVQSGAVKIAIAGNGGFFEGTLSSDARRIDGTWSQPGVQPTSLILTLASVDTAWVIPDPPAPVIPMTPNDDVSFEVATIKRTEARPEDGHAFRNPGRNFSTINTSLQDLITYGWHLHPNQLTGGPGWLDSERYDLNAKPEGTGIPSDAQWRQMVRKLATEHFKLAFHVEKKEMGVFIVTTAKAGPRLTASGGDPHGPPSLFFRGLGVLVVKNATIDDFASVMQAVALDRPVLDHTALRGKFDFTLRWTTDETQFGGEGANQPPPADNAPAPPTLFTAMQEELGLKMESTKAPVDVLVIDHAEKPGDN